MEYNIKVICSSRKTLVLSVSNENEITLKCPYGVSESRINSFIESKRNWLNKVIYQNELNLSENSEILNYRKIYFCGEKLPLVISDRNSICEEAVYVKNIKKIKSLFISAYSTQFINFVDEISQTTGLKYSGIELKRYKRRWGCCDSKKKLCFNFMLFMLPLSIQRYVIIHELCHTAHLNHSAEFWKLVKRFEPNYKNIRKQLKTFNYITNLY